MAYRTHNQTNYSRLKFNSPKGCNSYLREAIRQARKEIKEFRRKERKQ